MRDKAAIHHVCAKRWALDVHTADDTLRTTGLTKASMRDSQFCAKERMDDGNHFQTEP
jgi:hypothetical protein